MLHYFAMAAHTYTRGSWTTPEAVHPDKDVGGTDYVAAGVVTSTTYLKWMMLFEEPDNRTVWLAKALPRDWLTPGTEQVLVEGAPTRYGPVSYSLDAKLTAGTYTVAANVTLPPRFVAIPPRGGMRLRLRAPAVYAGKLKSVTVGGKNWAAIDAKAETIDFSVEALKAWDASAGSHIIATFGK